jgi:NADH-quinone oxidoreductase subunit C
MTKEENKLLQEIKATFKADGRVQREQRVWVSIDRTTLLEVCKWLKEHGFVHLSAISVTDWLEKGDYELTYHLWSYKDKILITVKTRIDRTKPTIESITPIWGESAQIHERELHELFGVEFKGNHDLLPLFLDDWHGPAPFRKDFDWRDYVRDTYYDKKNERERVYYD